MRYNIKQFLLMLPFIILIAYIFWFFLRPVEIVGVHDNDNHSYVLVKNFPLSDRGKIDWWFKNKDMLKAKYKIPKPATYGSYTIIFWLFGEGYKEEGKYDRLCFDDMKTKINCIDKTSLMMVVYSKNTGMYFRLGSGKYFIKKNGEIIKTEYN